MTSNADLAATLEAISETAERVTPDALCTVSTYDESASQRHIAGQRLSREFLKAIGEVGIAARNGSCAAAIFLQRQVVVAEIARDALGESAQARARRGSPRLLVDAHPRHRRADGRHRGALLPPAAKP